MERNFDVAVIGAGAFGAWTALTLRRRKLSILLVDAYGPAHSRASSGGESRIIRLGYGPDEIYTRWSARSLPQWRDLFERAGESLFHQTGVLWLAREGDTYVSQTFSTLRRSGAAIEKLTAREGARRFPQFFWEDVEEALFEPESGVLMAQQAVQATVRVAISEGVEYRLGAIIPPDTVGAAASIQTRSGDLIRARVYIFACGPWLPKLFPSLLRDRFFISRQEVYFFGVPAGDARFCLPQMPTWIFLGDEMYGMPSIEGRGVKLACDTHGPPTDPDTMERTPATTALSQAQDYLSRRFPGLAGAPIVESRVCQYENTSNGDFLVDRHPEMTNVWLTGGGSGHGFKHGPAMGEYVASQIFGETPPELRFLLASKKSAQRRTVF